MAIPAIAMEILMNQKLTHAAQNVSNVFPGLKSKKASKIEKKSITKDTTEGKSDSTFINIQHN